jgi:hypothetical protein
VFFLSTSRQTLRCYHQINQGDVLPNRQSQSSYSISLNVTQC